MFINSNSRLPTDEQNFMSMFANLLANDIEQEVFLRKERGITTNDLSNQISLALKDVFDANITLEENYVLKMTFSDNQIFKLRIIKE